MKDDKHVILCIDDDPDLLTILRIVLEANEYCVVTAASAQEGLKVYKQTQPDLVITDMIMEEEDSGAKLVRDLKILGNKAPVYVLSSIGDKLSSMANCQSLGLSGILQKPVDNDNLLALLRVKLK